MPLQRRYRSAVSPNIFKIVYQIVMSKTSMFEAHTVSRVSYCNIQGNQVHWSNDQNTGGWKLASPNVQQISLAGPQTKDYGCWWYSRGAIGVIDGFKMFLKFRLKSNLHLD